MSCSNSLPLESNCCLVRYLQCPKMEFRLVVALATLAVYGAMAEDTKTSTTTTPSATTTTSLTEISKLKRAMEGAVEYFMEPVQKQKVCPRGMIFCVKQRKCLPLNCKTFHQRHQLSLGIKRIVGELMNEELTARHHTCNRGMIFCADKRVCVPMNCQVRRSDKGPYKDRLMRGVRLMVERYMKKEGAKHHTCGRGLIYCMKHFKCVPLRCAHKSTYKKGPSVDNIGNALGELANYFIEKETAAGKQNVCPRGTIICMKTHKCVSTTCSKPKVNAGYCPAPKKSKNGECNSQRLCGSDSEGCGGNLKCCENACGGTSCSAPEFEVAGIVPYKVARYMASKDPDTIAINGNEGIFNEEIKAGNAPKYLKFDLTSATDGCVWQKLLTSEVPPTGDKTEKELSKTAVKTWEKITNNEEVQIDQPFSCIPNNLSFHGFAKVSVTDDSDTVHTLAVLILPIKLPPKIVQKENTLNVITFYEDTPAEVKLNVTVSSQMDLSLRKLPNEDLMGIKASPSGSTAYDKYTAARERLNSPEQNPSTFGVAFSIVTNLTVKVGALSLKKLSTSDDSKSSDKAVSAGNRDDKWSPIKQKDGQTLGGLDLKFEPEKDYYGEFEVAVKGHTPVKSKAYSTENITFIVKIISVNDAPYLVAKKLIDLALKPRAMWKVLKVPFDLSENTGLLVKEIVSEHFYDPDGKPQPLGMCVIRAESSDDGKYEYQLNGTDTWKKLAVDGPTDPFTQFGVTLSKMAKRLSVIGVAEVFKQDSEVLQELEEFATINHTCFLLPSDATVRFTPSGSGKFWEYNSPTKWDYLAWDEKADVARVPGTKLDITLPLCLDCLAPDSILSYAYLSGDAMRVDCNGKVSNEEIVNDICGDCGGDGSRCTDCEGNKDGPAVRNECGHCVLGTTEPDPKYGVDCRGSCSLDEFEIFPEANGLCLPDDTDVAALIKVMHCDGEWGSTAKMDKCGECTKKPNVDLCGVCGGDNSSCADCDKTLNGRKVFDACGVCRLKSDKDFDTGCQVISGFSPVMGFVGYGGSITIFGGFDSYVSVVACSLVPSDENEIDVSLDVGKFHRKNNSLEASYKSIAKEDTYSVRCTFKTKNGGDKELKIETGDTFDIKTLPVAESLLPISAVVGNIPNEIEVTGTGFEETDELYCYTDCPIKITRDCRNPGDIAVFVAEFVSKTTVKCLIPEQLQKKATDGFIAKVSVSLVDPRDLPKEILARAEPVDFPVIPSAPEIKSAKFIGACKVLIEFTEAISEKEKCSDVLDDVTTLGDDPVCSVRGRFLEVNLGKNSKLKADDKLQIKADAIAARGSQLVGQINYVSGDIEVTGTTEPTIKFEGFKASPAIGNCEPLILRAKFQGAGCSTLVYKWEVELSEASEDVDVNTDLAEIQEKLESIDGELVQLPSDDMVPGQSYVYTVYIVGEQSYSQTTTILRKVDAQPLMLSFNTDITDWDADRPLTLRVTARKSQCTELDLSVVEFIWSGGKAVELNFESFSSVEAKIPARTMYGGKTYIITVLATVSGENSFSTSASMNVTTQSKELIAKISRAPIIITGVSSKLVLDSSDSRDPDRAFAETEYFTWTCGKLAINSEGDLESQPCMIPAGDTLVQFESSEVVAVKTEKSITIPKDSLDSNGIYTFELTYTKSVRSDTATVIVYVRDGQPPDVKIVQLDGPHNLEKDFRLRAFVSSPQSFTASWSSISGEGFEVLDQSYFPDMVQHDGRATGFPVPLKITSGLKAGAEYKFQLSAEHDDSYAEAVVIVVVNAPPECTGVTVSAFTGDAFIEIFEVGVEGCDDDADDFPLTYSFFTDSVLNGVRRPLSIKPQSDSTFVTKLGEGVVRFGVTVCDQNKACSTLVNERNVTVNPIEIDVAAVEDLFAEILEQRALDGSSHTARSLIHSILNTLAKGVSEEVQEKVSAMAVNEANNALSQANPREDPVGSLLNLEAAMDSLIPTIGLILHGIVQSIDAGTQQQLMNTSTDTATNLVAAAADVEQIAKRRRKRAVSQEITINPLDVLSGESLMMVQVTALGEQLAEDISKEDAESFFNTLELVWQGVCADQVSGEEPHVGETALLTFRAFTSTFEGMANTSLYVSCSNCTDVTNPATFQMGSHLETDYTQWNCTDTETCYGGCLATGQLSHDILTASSDAIEPLISSRYSDIIAIHMVNPSTYGYTEMSNISTPITLTIPLTATPLFDTYEYMCRNWDPQTNDWSEMGCLPAALDNSSDIWIATCDCFTTGYFAVFEGEEINAETFITTTEFVLYDESTTVASYLEGLSEADVDSVTVTFKIDADSSLMLDDYAFVAAEITDWLIEVLQVEEERILNLALTPGSIVVEFDLAPGGDTDLNTLLSRLEDQVTSSASITIGGNTYTCIPDSFAVTVNEMTTESPVTELPKGLRMGVIIGIVVGCSMLIILIVVVVAVVVLKHKAGSNKIQHSPRASKTNLNTTELGTFEFKQTKASPADEAMYGPAPIPIRPSSVGKAAMPIGSRPVTRDEKRTMTPVS